MRQARDEWKGLRQPRMREAIHRLVFLDETGTTTKMTRLRGRARRGARLKAEAPFGHWATQTFIAGLQRRSELGLDIDVEDLAVHGLVDHPGRGQAIATQAGNERLRGPVPEGRMGLQPGATASSAAQTGHLGRRAGFVEEDQPVDPLAHARLAVSLPLVTRLAHVRALGLRGQQCFF